MTQDVSTPGYDSPAYTGGPDDSSSTKDVAKDQAAGVAGSAKDAGQHVAGVAKDQAANVATEATRQAKDVIGQARTELSSQAADQQQRVAGGLRSIGSELGSMAERSEDSGIATDLARQASSTVHQVADWLEQRDPASLLDEVKTFARRRPGAFLAIALGAGIAAGRLTRGLKDEAAATSTPSRTSSLTTPVEPVGGYTTAGYAEPGFAEPGYPAGQAVPAVSPYDAPVADAGTPYTGDSSYAGDTAYADDTYATPTTGAAEPVYVEETYVEKTTYTDEERR